jgi:hypothetical protein
VKRRNYAEIVKMLLASRQINLNTKNVDGKTTLEIIKEWPVKEEISQLLQVE